MPVIVPNGYEEQWTEQVKDAHELKGLIPIMLGWSSSGWITEEINKTKYRNKVVVIEKAEGGKIKPLFSHLKNLIFLLITFTIF